MSQYYDQILQLKAADEFIRVIKKWERLSKNLTVTSTDMPIILPDMLWVTKSGVGKTKLLRLMSEYLNDKGNLMEFYGDVKFFEFYLGYCSPSTPFTELQRLMDEVQNAAGFRNEFKGIIRIDVDDWLDHFEERYFIDFMEYLAANNDKWLIIISVDADNKKKLHNFEAFLSMYLRIEKITLNLPKTAHLFEYIEGNLLGYGLSLSDDGKELLYATIEKLRKSKYFDGFKSIRLLCQEIAYTVFTEGKSDLGLLTAEDLAKFAPDSEYVERTVINFEKAVRIGLVNKEDKV